MENKVYGYYTELTDKIDLNDPEIIWIKVDEKSQERAKELMEQYFSNKENSK